MTPTILKTCAINARDTLCIGDNQSTEILLFFIFNVSWCSIASVLFSFHQQVNMYWCVFIFIFLLMYLFWRTRFRGPRYLKNHLRKSKDYVYGIWVYKVLGIWKGYYRVKKSLVLCMKPWARNNNEYMKSYSNLHTNSHFKNVNRKVDYHSGGKWFIHGPKRRKENQLLSLKHPCWLSLV